jgi:hypothetical protein
MSADVQISGWNRSVMLLRWSGAKRHWYAFYFSSIDISFSFQWCAKGNACLSRAVWPLIKGQQGVARVDDDNDASALSE